MFDFFKKYFSKTEKKEDEPIASLTFYIKSDNTIPIIDVGLAGFEDDSLIYKWIDKRNYYVSYQNQPEKTISSTEKLICQ